MASIEHIPPVGGEFSEDPLSLLPCRTPRTLAKEQVIYLPDDPADSLFLVLDGAVKITRSGANGREAIVDFEPRESFFGFGSILGQPLRGETAAALEPATVMEWPVAELYAIMVETPGLGPALMCAAARKLADANERIDSLANDGTIRRLVKALLRLGERFGEPAGRTPEIRLMPLTHSMLARHIGTSREIVTQHMVRLRRTGAIDYSRFGLQFDPARLHLWLEIVK